MDVLINMMSVHSIIGLPEGLITVAVVLVLSIADKKLLSFTGASINE